MKYQRVDLSGGTAHICISEDPEIDWQEVLYGTRPARGEKMPQTPEQFKRMGDLYEKALLEKEEEIRRLKQRINKLEQKND